MNVPVASIPIGPTVAASGVGGSTGSRLAAPWVDWLVDQALPIWASSGVDRTSGGFFEAIDRSGQPVEAPRRARVVARQIYVFATAARRGWSSRGDDLVDHGLSFLLRKMLLPNGTFASAVLPDGTVVDGRFDLYEQSFVLFALASACRGRADRQIALRREAERLLRCIRHGWAHPIAGFEESRPRSLPLRSNPHMHLLEAALAWMEISEGDDRREWEALADSLVELCLTRFIDRSTGALREHFDGDWSPMPDASTAAVEPGHQFEWAWLLMRWAELRDRSQALRAASRLLEIGERRGVDHARGVAVDALDDRLRVSRATAKVWPQTERVKAWHRAAAATSEPTASVTARETLGDAIRTLSLFLAGSPAGLWHEQMGEGGEFIAQDCKASSLYHIVCAIDTCTAAHAWS